MTLSELVQPDLIKLDLESQSKWAVIEELVDHLITNHELRINDRQEVVAALVAREKSLSTGLDHGLAIPHGAVDCVRDIIAAIGITKKGVEFESQDGRPARLIVLLVIPKGAFQDHVRTLSGIARLASNKELREKIIASETPDQVLDIIYQFEGCEEDVDDQACL